MDEEKKIKLQKMYVEMTDEQFMDIMSDIAADQEKERLEGFVYELIFEEAKRRKLDIKVIRGSTVAGKDIKTTETFEKIIRRKSNNR
ncbi:MAG: hypothetical protein NTZ63_07220 [Candidatus Omnitrophica bacterium]|nr:hypothetical protein [Candidatus Omnitrophota bacterium]